MRILLLGDIDSFHIERWVRSFHSEDYKVAIFSLFDPARDCINSLDVDYLSIGIQKKQEGYF